MPNSQILLVEDHNLVREAMVASLAKLGEDYTFHQARDAEGALRSLEEHDDYDLVLIDLMLPDMNGFSLLGVIAKRWPELPVIVVSALDDTVSIRKAIKAGAAGFISKNLSSDELIDAVQRVLAGEVVVTQQDLNSMPPSRMPIDQIATRFGLSIAQIRVVELLAQGHTNREIADLLGLAEGTVKVHCSAIFRALDVQNRAQALVKLSRGGLRAG